MFVCIARTNIDWNALLPNARNALGRSVTLSLDSAGLPGTSGIPSFLCIVSEINKPGKALEQIRNDGLARRHASFSFLVNVPRNEFITMAGYGLSVTPAEDGDFGIVSGRFSEWVQAVAEGTQRAELRKFFCLLHGWFERESLGEAWSDWQKEHIAGDFYRLVKK